MAGGTKATRPSSNTTGGGTEPAPTAWLLYCIPLCPEISGHLGLNIDTQTALLVGDRVVFVREIQFKVSIFADVFFHGFWIFA